MMESQTIADVPATYMCVFTGTSFLVNSIGFRFSRILGVLHHFLFHLQQIADLFLLRQ